MTKECHVARVTTEQRHILLDPMQCCYLVHQPVIGDSSLQVWRQVGIQESWKYTTDKTVLRFATVLPNGIIVLDYELIVWKKQLVPYF